MGPFWGRPGGRGWVNWPNFPGVSAGQGRVNPLVNFLTRFRKSNSQEEPVVPVHHQQQ